MTNTLNLEFMHPIGEASNWEKNTLKVVDPLKGLDKKSMLDIVDRPYTVRILNAPVFEDCTVPRERARTFHLALDRVDNNSKKSL